MNDAEFQALKLEAQRRPPTPGEQAQLQRFFATHPDAREDWEEDAALTRVLRDLPEATLSSNFTALVLNAVEREAGQRTPSHRWPGWLRLWTWRPRARMATVLVVMALCVLTYHQYRASARAELAESVAVVSSVAALPSDVLQNVDAISLATPGVEVDVELLMALQ